MRIPIPIVIVLCLAVVGGVWWYGTRNADFMTPPSERKLAEVRQRVESSLPPADHLGDSVSSPAAPPPATGRPSAPVETKPMPDTGDFRTPPALDEYADLSGKGADYLIQLAGLLEGEGQFQRALIAWERVIDSAKPDETRSLAAIAAIQRLRPTLPDWNTDPSQSIPVILHAGTGEKTAKILTPILEETARELELASSGILKITTAVAVGRTDPATSGSPPVALWLAGQAKESPSTEVLSFTMSSPEQLREDVRKTTFQILRGFIARETPLTPPRQIKEGESFVDALNSHLSRRSWRDLGNLLNTPP